MSRLRGIRVTLVGVVVLGCTLVGIGLVGSEGGAVAAPARPAAGVKHVVSARTASTFAMPAPGVSPVQTVKLPAGAWSVIAKATAVDLSTADFVRCSLLDATNHVVLDGATTFVGNGAVAGAPLTNIATVVVPTGGTVKVVQQCGHDAASGNSAYLDPDATVVAFQTLDGSAAGQQLVSTAASTPLTASDTTVASLSLAAGRSYAIGLKFSAVSFSGTRTAVGCELAVPRGFGGASDVEVGAPTSVATGAFFAYVDGGATVTLTCRLNGAAGAYLDPQTVLWARAAKASTAVEGGCGSYLVNAKTDLIAMDRATASCPFKGTSLTRISGVSISAGTWVVVGGESELQNTTASSDDFARCQLNNTDGLLDASATWETLQNYTGLTVLGTFKAAGPDSVLESCKRDTSTATSTSFGGGLILIKV